MKNRYRQQYITRNCFFEPGSGEKTDWVDSCLSEIRTAFRYSKPAIICSHRVNYIGSLNPKNRDNGLAKLKDLLNRIKKYWPDVEFISSDVLGDMMLKKEGA